MKPGFSAIGAALLLYGCILGPAQAAPSADKRFQAIHEAEWKWRREQQLADEDDSRGQVESTLPRVDAATQARRLAYWEGVLRRLDALDTKTLSPAARLNYRIYRAQIAALVAQLRFREYEQPLNADSAFWTDVTYGAREPFKTKQDYYNYLARLESLPRYFSEQLDNMRAGLTRGFTPPRVTLTGRDSALASVVAAAPEEEFELLAAADEEVR